METSKTEYWDDWEPVTTEPGMPLKLVAWRQTLSEKAKQDKKKRKGSEEVAPPAFSEDEIVQLEEKGAVESKVEEAAK